MPDQSSQQVDEHHSPLLGLKSPAAKSRKQFRASQADRDVKGAGWPLQDPEVTNPFEVDDSSADSLTVRLLAA